MSAEYPGAGWVACPGFGFPQGAHGRNGQQARWIVLHGTASGDGTAEQQARYFSGASDHGVHFVIGKDGTVIQLVALADAAYGNGGPTAQEMQQHQYAAFWQPTLDAGVNLNLVTVSIEHCKIASDNSDVLTPAQQDASFRLVAWLCQTLSIPPRQADEQGGITGHCSINGIERVNCPGVYPWEALWSVLGASMTPKGPFYQVTAGQNGVPSSGNAIAEAMGLTWPDILAIPGQPANLKDYDPTGPFLVGPGTYGVSFLLPGFPAPVAPAPGPDPKATALRQALKDFLAE